MSVISSGLVNIMLYSVTAKGTELEVFFRDFTFLIAFQIFLDNQYLSEFENNFYIMTVHFFDKRFLYCLYLKYHFSNL